MRNTLKRKIIDLRLAAGLTQKTLAKLLRVNQSQVSQWELGWQTPTNSYLRKIIGLAEQHSIEITRDDILSTNQQRGRNGKRRIKRHIQKQTEQNNDSNNI